MQEQRGASFCLLLPTGELLQVALSGGQMLLVAAELPRESCTL